MNGRRSLPWRRTLRWLGRAVAGPAPCCRVFSADYGESALVRIQCELVKPQRAWGEGLIRGGAMGRREGGARTTFPRRARSSGF